MSRIDQVDNLTTFELETLARFLLHHMPQGTRRKLMSFTPGVYRKLLGLSESDARVRFGDNWHDESKGAPT